MNAEMQDLLVTLGADLNTNPELVYIVECYEGGIVSDSCSFPGFQVMSVFVLPRETI